jgi:hypothetical protein
MSRYKSFANLESSNDRLSELENLIEQAHCEKASSFCGLQLMPECWRRKHLDVSQWCGICQLKRKAGL